MFSTAHKKDFSTIVMKTLNKPTRFMNFETNLNVHNFQRRHFNFKATAFNIPKQYIELNR